MTAAVLLDTHALLWLVSDPDLLSHEAINAVDAAPTLLLSAISPWEVAVKHQQGRLRLDYPVRDWMRAAVTLPRLELIPLDPEIAIRSAELRESVGRDPADCVITATALVHDVPIITRDRVIGASRVVQTIW